LRSASSVKADPVAETLSARWGSIVISTGVPKLTSTSSLRGMPSVSLRHTSPPAAGANPKLVNASPAFTIGSTSESTYGARTDTASRSCGADVVQIDEQPRARRALGSLTCPFVVGATGFEPVTSAV
jgi:hypothetical protein